MNIAHRSALWMAALAGSRSIQQLPVPAHRRDHRRAAAEQAAPRDEEMEQRGVLGKESSKHALLRRASPPD